MKTRSDALIPKIQDEVIKLLTDTNLSCTKIGEIFGCSRGPIWNIQKQNTIERKFNPGRKHFPKECKWCNEVKLFRNYNSTRPNRGKFCSKECYRQWQKSEDNKGINNPCYVDGGKHEDYLNHLRKSDEWKEWRTKVFERDNYTCQLCGDRGIELHPHHIKQKSDFPDMIFVVDNGMTLCKECHRSKGVHSYKGNVFQMFLDIVSKKNEAQLFHR